MKKNKAKGSGFSFDDIEKNVSKKAGLKTKGKKSHIIKILVGLFVGLIVCGIIQIVSWTMLLF